MKTYFFFIKLSKTSDFINAKLVKESYVILLSTEMEESSASPYTKIFRLIIRE